MLWQLVMVTGGPHTSSPLDSKLVRAPRIALCRTNEWDLVQPEMRKAFEDAGAVIGAR